MRFPTRLRPMLQQVLLATTVIAATLYAAAAHRQRSDSLLRPDDILELALELDDAALKSLEAAPGSDVPGRLYVGDAPHPRDIVVRVKGQRGSKRSIVDKPSLKIATRNGERVLGHEQLTLNNMVQDPTMVHEALGYQVYDDAGVPVPETAYVSLTLNGQPRGLYVLVETIDRHFLRRRFGDDTGILYEAAYGTDFRAADVMSFELDEGKDPDRAELTRLIDAIAASGDDVFYGNNALVDTGTFLSMMAVQVVIADWDNYYQSNNYRIYWNPAARRWSFIPTGIDQAFTEHPVRVTAFGATGVLFLKCRESERCTKDYLAALGDAADRFERLNLPQKMDRLLAIIDPAAHADPKKPYSAAKMRAARLEMRRFIVSRPKVVRSASLPE